MDGNDATEGGEGAHNGDSLIVEALRDELNSAQVADVASDSDSDPETEVRLALRKYEPSRFWQCSFDLGRITCVRRAALAQALGMTTGEAKTPLVSLRIHGQDYQLYRCMLPPPVEAVLAGGTSVALTQLAGTYAAAKQQGGPVWVVMMSSAGHFAAAVFRRASPEVHKTFHRYVVRAKQGGRQSTRDAGGSAPQSAGATLRRYNEAMLAKDIAELLASWHVHLAAAELILYHAPGAANRKILFTGASPLRRTDPRVRGIPFKANRPSYLELQRIVLKLSTITVGEGHAADKAEPGALIDRDTARTGGHAAAARAPNPTALAVDSARETPAADALAPSSELHAAVKQRSMRLLRAALDEIDDERPIGVAEEDRAADEVNVLDASGCSALIAAARCDRADMVRRSLLRLPPCHANPRDPSARTCCAHTSHLRTNGRTSWWPLLTAKVLALLEAGADPTIKLGVHTAYTLAGGKSVRDTLRRFMAAHPEQWDYDEAKIPSALTEEMELKQQAAAQAKADKEAAKKREAKKKAKAKAKAKEEAEQAQRQCAAVESEQVPRPCRSPCGIRFLHTLHGRTLCTAASL